MIPVAVDGANDAAVLPSQQIRMIVWLPRRGGRTEPPHGSQLADSVIGQRAVPTGGTVALRRPRFRKVGSPFASVVVALRTS